jgi:tetratricopeptide (TPR) repeat protein
MGDIGCCRAIWIFGCLLALVSAPGHAQPRQDSTLDRGIDEPRLWAVGVSETEQATALELYVAGNREFMESRFAQALAKYKEAIRHWDHPAIRFNMAVCLINLDQPLEAKDGLERSLAYGDRPLGGDDRYQQGLTYRKLLDAQLARVKVSCPESGMLVTLDGKFLLTGPATVEETVLPGEHQLVAMKLGFLTETTPLILVAGKQTTYEVRPLERKTAARMVRRWEAWKPWLAMAGGSVLFGLGVASHVAAANSYARYDADIKALCPPGCVAMAPTSLGGEAYLRNQGDVERVFAYSLISAGGAVFMGGLIGVILNQPRLQLEPSHAQPVVAVSSGGALFSTRWEF